MMDSVILKKDGFYSKTWDYNEKKKKGKYLIDKLSTSYFTFFEAWNSSLKIEEVVTLKDVAVILKNMDNEVLTVVENLCCSNLKDYLAKDLTPKKDPDTHAKLKCIEIYKIFEKDNYDDINKWELTHHTSAHGLGSNWKEGKGNAYAIAYTDWSYLLNLPIKLNTTGTLCTTTWKKVKKHKILNGLSVSDRKHVSYKQEDVETYFTVGEFFTGLLNELCFFSSPLVRERNVEELKKRLKEVKTAK
jgi:hypothetical protein